MTVALINNQNSNATQLAVLREQMFDLQRQLSTGKKSETYGGLGNNRLNVLSLRDRSSTLEGYMSTIDQVDIRLKTIQQHLTRLDAIAGETRSNMLTAPFDIVSGGQTQFQLQSAELLNETVSLLNFELAGRHYFSGRSMDTQPVVEMDLILNGDGTRAGLKQLIAERKLADLGADGRGRLVIPGTEASVLGNIVATPGDIGGVAATQLDIDIGGNLQSFDISDGGIDDLAALELAIDTAFGADVASIVGGNQLQLTATNTVDTITVTDIVGAPAALVGLTTGATTNPGTNVTIAQDVDPNIYGLKLSGINSNTLSGTTASLNAGPPPDLDVSFTPTLPNAGETLALRFDLPDGSQEVIALTAVSGVPANPGEFEIGTDEFITTANFQAAVIGRIETLAQSELAAASAITATQEMFVFDDTNPPLRVGGPPFETAVAQQNATAADTVFWYQGEAGTDPARGTALAKIDDNLVMSYGSRANEEAFTTVISGLALMAAETFSDSNPNDQARFRKLAGEVATITSFPNGTQSTRDLIGEFVFKQSSVEKANERHQLTEFTTADLLGQFEQADNFEISAQILQLQTQLQASFETTSILSRLSLVNFL